MSAFGGSRQSAIAPPPPLWGRVGVGGLAALSDLAFGRTAGKAWRDPPSLALPHKGGGNPIPPKPACCERTAFARVVQPETASRTQSPYRPIVLALASSHHQVPGAPTPSFGCRSGRAKASQ